VTCRRIAKKEAIARAAKTAKTKVAAKRPAVRKSAPARQPAPTLAQRLAEALEQQTATSDILRVISQSPTNVQPVLDTIVAAAKKLCSAGSANAFTFDGELIHLAAFVNVDSEYIESLRRYYPRPPGRDSAVLRSILTCAVVEIPDTLEGRVRGVPSGRRNVEKGGGYRPRPRHLT
jgi:hypothetical protein